jgi:Myb-like DNA-binding domain
VRNFGAQWRQIASLIPGRNRRQCKEHWKRVLSKRPCAAGIELDDPDMNNPEGATNCNDVSMPSPGDLDVEDATRRGLWSADEDAILKNAYAKYGPKWRLVATKVPGRGKRQCEKRYRRLKLLEAKDGSPVFHIVRPTVEEEENMDSPMSVSSSSTQDELAERRLSSMAAVANVLTIKAGSGTSSLAYEP